jgi:acyl carrier protein
MELESIEIGSFIRNFEEQFEHPVPGGIGPDTPFHDLAEWNSLQAVMVATSLDMNYGVTLTGEELRSARTIQDLFALVRHKKKG